MKRITNRRVTRIRKKPIQKKQERLTQEELDRIELDRKLYDDLSSNQSNLLDKSIISISGASFTIAIGFINKLIPMENAEFSSVFWVSLCCLALTIITTILSFYYSEKIARFMRNVCDEAESKQDYSILESARLPWNGELAILNIARLFCFITGILLLTFFIGYNGFYNCRSIDANKEVMMDSRPKCLCLEERAIPTVGKKPLQPLNEGVVPPPPRPKPINPVKPQSPSPQPPIKK